MVIERFTNLTFDNRSIILHGGQSSLSTFSKANIRETLFSAISNHHQHQI